MIALHPQYITDSEGKKLSVVINIQEFNHIIEELEDIRLYDKAKKDTEPSLPIDEAFRHIDAKRSGR